MSATFQNYLQIIDCIDSDLVSMFKRVLSRMPCFFYTLILQQKTTNAAEIFRSKIVKEMKKNPRNSLGSLMSPI